VHERSEWSGARWAAAAVHVFTASGAVLAFLATLAAVEGEARAAFLWLLCAVAVDAADGWLARFARVSERLPRVSGARLDDLVDYLTYVFVPMLIVSREGPRAGGRSGTAVTVCDGNFYTTRWAIAADPHEW